MSMLKALAIDNTNSCEQLLNRLGAQTSRALPEKINSVEQHLLLNVTVDTLTALTALKKLAFGQQSFSLLLLSPLFSIFEVTYSPLKVGDVIISTDSKTHCTF